ncbi:sensor histidine kinase [Robiginitalea sp. IMCC43444]|uniref:sensor histidine kinase n=1 Tax=Robiginitalea sp. IMCC43444 TaxID=3459121 RepID=UPI0040438C06
MEITEKNRNRIFWGLQLLGWGSINLLSVLFLGKLSNAFIIFSVVTGTLIGVGTTSLLRYYLRARIHYDDFGLKEVLRIGLATLITSAIFGMLNLALGYIYVKFGPALNELDVEILKTFESPWLLVINSLFLISGWVICYLVIKLLLKINRDRMERLELNASLKQAQLNTLKGQINPHFMFNSLNNIRGLMLEDVAKAREMLTKLSEMLRYSLSMNNVNAISLREELEMVDNYIELSKIQLEDRLKFNKLVEQTTLDRQIPPMIVQLLVENAVKHGISTLKAGGTITLNIDELSDSLRIEVRNTGSLKISNGSTQLGLKNIRQRLKLLFGNTADFKIDEREGEVVAVINIPK